MPHFTVVCPTWNRGKALRSTVLSVLNQSDGDFQLVIASDASSDDTDTVAQQLAEQDSRILFLRTRRYGFQAGPINEALALTDSACVAYIDHDDLWHPDHLATMRSLLEEADVAATSSRKIDLTGRVLSSSDPISMLWHPEAQILSPLFENSAAAHRRWLVDATGGWTESEIGLEDWDLWLRCTDAGARVATTLNSTVDILEAPTTRQNSLPLAFGHALAVFPDSRSARAAQRRLIDPRLIPVAFEACLEDMVAWYSAARSASTLVFPKGWKNTSQEFLRASIEDHLRRVGTHWQPLTIEKTEHGWVLAIPIGTMTEEHTQRYQRTFAQRMPRQMEFFRDVLQGAKPLSALVPQPAATVCT